MFKIRTYNKIAQTGLVKLTNSTISANQENPDAIILRSHKLKIGEFGDNLLAVGRAGAECKNIPVEECTNSGIVVLNTPGANANAVKELVIAGLLLSSRKLFEGTIAINNPSKDFENIGHVAESIKGQFVGPEIANKRLGIIGLGAIGLLVAQAAKDLGMKIIAYDPYADASRWTTPGEIKQVNQLKYVVSQCDYLTIHIPHVSSTENLVNYDLIKYAKRGIKILNFARGEIVCTPDIIRAIDEKIVSYYVTDFAQKPLMNKENILVFPHLGASTPEAEDNCSVMVCKQIREYLETGNITNSVNFPNVNIPQTGLTRLAVFHENKPGMFEKISNIFANANINLNNTEIKSKGDIAYLLTELGCSKSVGENKIQVSNELLQKVNELDGVIRTRVM